LKHGLFRLLPACLSSTQHRVVQQLYVFADKLSASELSNFQVGKPTSPFFADISVFHINSQLITVLSVLG
jgi:hypothetical protein